LLLLLLLLLLLADSADKRPAAIETTAKGGWIAEIWLEMQSMGRWVVEWCSGCCVNLPTQSKVICGSLFTFGFYFLVVHSDSDDCNCDCHSKGITIETTDGQQIEAPSQHVDAATVC